MVYEGLAGVAVIVGVLVLLLSLRVLLRAGWFMGWLRGMLGLALVVAGVLFGLAALDVLAYKQYTRETTLATISFEKLSEQHYKAVIVDGDGFERRFILKGDQWQLDARIVKWPGLFATWGMKPGYRLDRISGRYYSLEKERNAERTVYSMSKNQNPLDLWSWVQKYDNSLPFVDAVYGSAAYLPMGDGAEFEVSLSNTGLLARPVNDPARLALSRWQ